MLRHLLRTKNLYIMKKNILTLLAVCALAIGGKAQTELPLLPTAHGMLGNQPAFTAQQQQEFPMMATGWNWWSSYIDLSDDGLEMLETTLGSNANTIKSQTDFISYRSDVGWIGSLNSINNQEMYMIEMRIVPAGTLTLTGRSSVNIEDVELTAHGNGWTWISYPGKSASNLGDAMSLYTANTGDVVKGMDAFSTYYNGIWIGELSSLQPGQGYMIQNTGNSDVIFNFASSRNVVEPKANLTQWTASIHEYPTNMNMIAVINLMGEELKSSDFEVAAYSNGKCRGSVIPQFVEPFNRYMAFLTINGNQNDPLEFRLMNHTSGEVYVASNRYNYSIDAVEGTLENPYILNFNTILGFEELAANHADVFPNPVERGQMVKVSISSNRKNLKVQVINALGMVVMTTNMNGEEMEFAANFAPGFYTLKVVESDKQLYVEKLIVK